MFDYADAGGLLRFLEKAKTIKLGLFDFGKTAKA